MSPDREQLTDTTLEGWLPNQSIASLPPPPAGEWSGSIPVAGIGAAAIPWTGGGAPLGGAFGPMRPGGIGASRWGSSWLRAHPMQVPFATPAHTQQPQTRPFFSEPAGPGLAGPAGPAGPTGPSGPSGTGTWPSSWNVPGKPSYQPLRPFPIAGIGAAPTWTLPFMASYADQATSGDVSVRRSPVRPRRVYARLPEVNASVGAASWTSSWTRLREPQTSPSWLQHWQTPVYSPASSQQQRPLPIPAPLPPPTPQSNWGPQYGYGSGTVNFCNGRPC